MAALMRGDPPSPLAVQQVQRECSQTGFLALVNHGIPASSTSAVLKAGAAFFALPMAAKEAYIVGAMQRGRGYEVRRRGKAAASRDCEGR